MARKKSLPPPVSWQWRQRRLRYVACTSVEETYCAVDPVVVKTEFRPCAHWAVPAVVQHRRLACASVRMARRTPVHCIQPWTAGLHLEVSATLNG